MFDDDYDEYNDSINPNGMIPQGVTPDNDDVGGADFMAGGETWDSFDPILPHEREDRFFPQPMPEPLPEITHPWLRKKMQRRMMNRVPGMLGRLGSMLGNRGPQPNENAYRNADENARFMRDRQRTPRYQDTLQFDEGMMMEEDERRRLAERLAGRRARRQSAIPQRTSYLDQLRQSKAGYEDYLNRDGLADGRQGYLAPEVARRLARRGLRGRGNRGQGRMRSQLRDRNRFVKGNKSRIPYALRGLFSRLGDRTRY